jgi:YidC/Oxa1 family membrane protein insertase
MNFFYDLWILLVFQPQLNALQFFYNLTNDTGIALIIVTVLVNLPLWPLIGKSYLYSQKMRYLTPKLTVLREKYKDEPTVLMQKMGEFNKVHNLDGSVMFKYLFLQMFVVTGLYWVSRSVGEAVPTSGLYESYFKTTTSSISHKAFGGLVDISASSTSYPIFIVISFVFTFALGWYTFKVLPKIPVPTPLNEEPEKKQQRESMEKSSEFIGIWLSPILILFFNSFIPTGVNIYTAVVAVLALLRQYLIANYYRTHVKEMIENALETDPSISEKEINAVENLVEVETSEIISRIDEPKKVQPGQGKSKNSNHQKKKKKK